MKGPDESVERVLSGLGKTEAPEGLEARVLARMRDSRIAAQGKTPQLLSLERVGRGSWAVAAGLMAVLSLVTGWGVFRGANEQARPRAGFDRGAPATGPQGGGPKPNVAGQTQTRPEKPRAQRAPRPATAALERKNVVEAWRQDPHFLRRMHAVGFPAPPQPLTTQERLLRQIAERGDAVQRAELDATERAKRDADEANAVMAFFEPPRDPMADTPPKREEEKR